MELENIIVFRLLFFCCIFYSKKIKKTKLIALYKDEILYNNI